MNKTFVIILILVGVIVLGGLFLTTNKPSPSTSNISQDTIKEPSPTSEIIDKQAAFAIFTNGTFRLFSASMYHNLSPDVYIQSDNPNIIHVKKAGITWNDFFKTLPFKLTLECLTTGTKETFCTNETRSLKFYLNGKSWENVLDQEIQSGDKLLVTYGNDSDEAIEKQIEKIPEPVF